ncbi:MAG: SGNH/GDSL hydrolase family protein [Actinobacteria bacterium]|nr:SGNH/GDSL hydrolase family protein [Actinomycetota bacterium]
MLRVFCLVLALVLTIPAAQAAQAAERDPGWSTGGDRRACSAPVWPSRIARGEPGLGRRVLVIGDSLARESKDDIVRGLRRSGWTPTIRCFGGKRLDWALGQIERARVLGQLPGIVVIVMGTNDMRWIDRSTTRGRMNRVARELKGRTVVWVDTYGSGGDRFTRSKQRWINRQIRRVDRAHPHVHRVAWGALAEEAGVRFASALHYGRRGERLFARALVNGVNRASG